MRGLPSNMGRRLKALTVNIREKYRRFREWQVNPFDYEMPDETHRCENCGYDFTGNYCPRCSQKAGLGAMTWRSVRESVMEIWGVGTRSMTYSLWQLFTRPGYLIRDYVTGKRQVSFPPVKMLLIVALILTLADSLLFPEKLLRRWLPTGRMLMCSLTGRRRIRDGDSSCSGRSSSCPHG